jgi:hypothetical protein
VGSLGAFSRSLERMMPTAETLTVAGIEWRTTIAQLYDVIGE